MVWLSSHENENEHKISQTEFNAFYLYSLEDNTYYRNANGGLDLPTFLSQKGFSLDLSGLILRHLDLRHATFSGICTDYTDLRGARCHFADFTGVDCSKMIIDISSQFHNAKLTIEQLIILQAETISTQPTSTWVKETKDHSLRQTGLSIFHIREKIQEEQLENRPDYATMQAG